MPASEQSRGALIPAFSVMSDLFDEIPGSIDVTAEPPRPNWTVVADWVARRPPSVDRFAQWRDLAVHWLDRIAFWSGTGLRADARDEFVLLSPYPKRDADRVLRFLQQCRRQILGAFPDVSLKDIVGPFAAIVFADEQSYYDYISAFYPEEGEWGTSSGLYVRSGYGHVVTMAVPASAVRRTLAHELVHAHFAHRNLPLWVEEGLTQSATDVLVGTSSLSLDRELVERHRAYWTRHGLGGFWSGTAFHDPGDGQELAYSLAYIIFARELADRRKAFLRFLKEADDRDFGSAACEAYLGEPLQALVERFLGPIVPRPHV